MNLDQRQQPTLLVVEDSDEDFESLMRIFKQIKTAPFLLRRCTDGDDAIDLLNQRGNYQKAEIYAFPTLVILDLNLPGTDGREVLTAIKQSEALKTIPVVILSTSSNPKDIQYCYQFGCNSYMLKTMNHAALRDSIKTMLDYWFQAVVLPEEVVFHPSR
jgi:CheY-like chemotaxis protein